MADTLAQHIGDRMAYDARQRAWARQHGLRYVSHPCLSKLLGERCNDERSRDAAEPACALHRPPHPDHDTMWRKGSGRLPVLYLSQPYDWSAEDARETAAVCEDRGLAWTVDPAAAWHYPGHVAGVVIWNPVHYTYEPHPISAAAPPEAGLVARRAARERRTRRKSQSAYATLCHRLDALFYPDTPEGSTIADLLESEEEAAARSCAVGADGLSEDDLAAIEERCRGLTPAPWHWTQDIVNDYIRDGRGRRAWRDQYVYILAGRGQRYQDSWDHNVLRLQWSQIKGDTFMGSPSKKDAAFIAAARSDVPRLLAEVRRLRTELARQQSTEHDGRR